MSNEISVSVGLNVNKSGARANRSESVQVDMTGDALTHTVQEIGTSNEAIAISADIGTYGYCFLKNLDDTNYVEFSKADDANYMIKLKAGECALFRIAANALYAKANTAACDVEIIVIED